MKNVVVCVNVWNIKHSHQMSQPCKKTALILLSTSCFALIALCVSLLSTKKEDNSKNRKNASDICLLISCSDMHTEMLPVKYWNSPPSALSFSFYIFNQKISFNLNVSQKE